MKASLTLQSHFLSSKVTSELGIEVDLEPGQLSEVVDCLISTLLVPVIDSLDQSLKDIQGRSPGRSLIIDPQGPKPRGAELLMLSGSIDHGKRSDTSQSEEFWCCVESKFKSFGPPGHITHTVSDSRSEGLPKWLPWRALGRAIPIVPNYIRGGLESFEGKAISAIFGVAPMVKEWVAFEATQSRLVLALRGSQVVRSGTGPMKNAKLQQPISKMLAVMFAIDLEQLWHNTSVT